MLFNILALIALLLVLALLKRIACILPSVVTCMFRWKENVNIDTSLRLRTERDLASAAMLLPFSMGSLSGLSLSDMTTENWMQLSYVLFCGTFLSYLIVPIGQKTLRPTVVAMYNYLQPIWAAVFAIICGQDQLTPVKIPAVLLIFTGVMMVNKRSH